MELVIDATLELFIRLILLFAFLYIDRQQPYIRHIEEEELWLYRYPSVDSIVPKVYLWMLLISIPALVFCLEYIYYQRKEDLMNNLLALSLTYALTGIFTVTLKSYVGRPRPNFFYRCFPDGVGMDIRNCTGNYKAVMDARRSFPSGHSSFAFAGMSFVTRRLFCLLDVKNTKTGKGYKLVIAIIPIVIAVLIAISRTCDYHHHYSDVYGGAVLGTLVSYLVYNTYYNDAIEV